MRAATATAVRAVARRPRLVKGFGLLLPLAAMLLVPALGSTFYTSLALSVLVFALVAMSLDLLGGYTGLISLTQGSLFGLGAYGVAYAQARGMGPWVSVAFALGTVLIVGCVFGAVAIRAGGITFIILTLALGQIIWGLAYRWVSVSGGDNGLPILQRIDLGPINLVGNDQAYYYFVVAVFCACAGLMWLIVRSPFGLTLRGIRDNEPRMRTLGYNVTAHKLVAFVIAAGFAGVGGILNGFYTLYISPTALDFLRNGIVVLMAVVGGLGTLWGGFVGAVVIVLMQQWMSSYVARWATVMGVLFVLVVLFLRAGIYGSLVLGMRRLAAWADAPPASHDGPTPPARLEPGPAPTRAPDATTAP
jgi:branched-chain amino acid transport system permease protein